MGISVLKREVLGVGSRSASGANVLKEKRERESVI